jgi:hypothetical protein
LICKLQRLYRNSNNSWPWGMPPTSQSRQH